MKKAVASQKSASKATAKNQNVKNQFVNKNVITKKDLDRKFETLSKIPPSRDLHQKSPQSIIETPPQISYNFEAFVRVASPGRRTSINSTITIYSNGIFSVNKLFMNKLEELGDFTHVKLFYDKASNAIGISFKEHANEGCLHLLTKSEKNKYSRFSSKAFFTYYGLDLDKIKGKYTPQKTYINREIGDVWVLDLKKHA